MQVNPDKYRNIAYKLVPIGGHPTMNDLRHAIPKAIAECVTFALAQEVAENFPGVAALQADLNAKEKRLVAREQELEKLSTDLEKRDRKLTELIKAVEIYTAWMDGQGEVDENGKRFGVMLAALKSYKECKK
jgi:septal ring factor EnvC (AmiA/AmiB activator)